MVNWGDGVIVSFDASSMYQNADGVLVPYITEPTATSPGSLSLVHIYNVSGPEAITVTITDKDGRSSTVSELVGMSIATSTSPPTSSTGGNSVYGQPVTFTATVADQASGGPTPTGSVEFLDTTTNVDLGSVPLSASGVAMLSTAVLPVGAQSIEAIYLPDPAFQGGTSTAIQQTVGEASTTTSVSTPPSSASFGQSVNITATVTSNAPSTAPALPPTGTVDFYDTTTGDDLTPGGVPLAGGSASLNFATLPVGTQIITETYSGDGNFETSGASTSESIVVAIYVLNAATPAPAITGTVYLSGGSAIDIPGRLIVDSPARPAVTVSGTSQIIASSIGVVGTVSEAGTATISPNPTTGIAAVADPLAGLTAPVLTGTPTSVNLTSGSDTISPGLYSQIVVRGQRQPDVQPGDLRDRRRRPVGHRLGDDRRRRRDALFRGQHLPGRRRPLWRHHARHDRPRQPLGTHDRDLRRPPRLRGADQPQRDLRDRRRRPPASAGPSTPRTPSFR